MNNENNYAKFIGINRHRINRDGKGVTTLAAFYSCPLRCRYCINSQCFDPNIICQTLTPKMLLKKVMIDDLIFKPQTAESHSAAANHVCRAVLLRNFTVYATLFGI